MVGTATEARAAIGVDVTVSTEDVGAWSAAGDTAVEDDVGAWSGRQAARAHNTALMNIARSVSALLRTVDRIRSRSAV